MLTYNREYNYIGELILRKSHILGEFSRPIDDKVNWLFLKSDNRQFSFVYKIEEPLKAEYDTVFRAMLAFTMPEVVGDVVKLNTTYEILRGQESIGSVRLLVAL